MIEITNVSKSYDDIKAIDGINLTIREGAVFGLVGTNGAGKSTLLRMITGILRNDEGSITIDGLNVYENIDAKNKFFYISDEQFFPQNATPVSMAEFYSSMYASFDMNRFTELIAKFNLVRSRRVATFSKGMKKQLSILLGICAGTKYLICDETFDGLDPVMRQAVKSMFAAEMVDRDFTPIIASHNLRELEDICDHVGLLHRGGVLLSKDLADMKENIHKIQCVLKEGQTRDAFKGLDILNIETRGSLYTVTARGLREDILNYVQQSDPLFVEALPLSLEEIFISETGGVGYDIKKILF